MALQLTDDLIDVFQDVNFFANLPDDITKYIDLWYLSYRDQLSFTLCSNYLYRNYGSYLYRYYCCGNCDSPLFHPNAIQFTQLSELNPDAEIEMDRNIKLEDGDAAILKSYENKSLLLPTMKDIKLRSNITVSTETKLCFDMQFCKGLSECFEELQESISFRLLLMLFGDDNFDELKSERLQIITHSVVCKQCKLFLGFKVNHVQNLKPDKKLSNNFIQNVLNRLIICTKYIRLVSLNKHINTQSRIGIYCTGARGKFQGHCGNLLTFKDQMLSDEHCWTINNKRENANYYNSVRETSVDHRHFKMVQCAQGNMMCCAVFCAKCDAEIGWRFELKQTQLNDESHYNQNQYGRYGLVHSSITHYTISEFVHYSFV